jgi:hypothetical protein
MQPKRDMKAIVNLFLAQEDVEADSKDRDDRSPLSFAAGLGRTAVVKR